MNEQNLTISEVLTDRDGQVRRKAKIVATIGPSSSSPEVLEQLILAGTNVFRLNFSHGAQDEHHEALTQIRNLSKKLDTPVAVLQDLPGPKIRISKVEGDCVELKDGASLTLCSGCSDLSSAEQLCVETVQPHEFLEAGDRILLGDGGLVLEATAIKKDKVTCKIIKGGELRSRAGITFPDSTYELPAVTEQDLKSLEWGVKHGVDFIALSFVSSAEDVLKARDAIRKAGGHSKLVAKIERRVAVENIESILDVSDGIMIARGDLGLELPLEKVPVLQKLLIQHATRKGIPVIVATQMLQSMVHSITPTRAEVADVSLAVLNGADAIMLSAESAIGDHPVEAVRQLDRIAREAERRPIRRDLNQQFYEHEFLTVPDAIVFAACGAALKADASAVIACTETGNSARLCAKYRPEQPLYGVSSVETTIRRMCLYWGVTPIYSEPTGNHDEELRTALRNVQLRENLPNGSWAVVTGGASVRTPGATSILEIREMNFQ